MSVTIRPNAPYHSIYLGAPALTPLSMKSKSSTRFKEATITTTTLNPIPIKPEPLMEIDAWLASFRRFWSVHVDALERHLDQTDPVPRRKGRKR